MRRTPTGQRPQLNQAHSSGWRWPRLVPIQEQQARASQDSQSPPRTSGAQSLHGEGEQTSSTIDQGKTPAINNLHKEADVGETAPAPTSEGHSSEADKSMPSTGTGEDRPTNSVPMSGSVGNPSYARGSSVKSPERKHSDTMQDDTFPVEERATASLEYKHSEKRRMDSSASEDLDIGSTDRMPASLEHKHSEKRHRDSSVSGDPDIGSADGRPSHQPDDDDSQIEGSAANSEGRAYPSGAKASLSTVSSLNEQSSANGKELDTSDIRIDRSLGDLPNEAEQEPDLRRKTASNQEGTGVQSTSEDEVPKAADNSEAKAADSDEENSGEPTPLATIIERLSTPDDPIPYYATPKIMVHKPSGSYQSDTSGPRTIDEILARERAGVAFEDQVPSREIPLPSADTTELPITVLPQLTRLPTGAVVQKAHKVKKRSLYLRKARNLAARKTILKATLGRQLAIPTKQSLRQLANGETAVAEFPVASSILP